MIKTKDDFALAWRWTGKPHAELPDDVLSGLIPLPTNLICDKYDTALRLDQCQKTTRNYMTEGSRDDVKSFLRSILMESCTPVYVMWDNQTGLSMPWGTFIKYWDDFCYPSSDDVYISLPKASWLLAYRHWGEFELKP